MREVDLPLTGDPYANVDEVELDGVSAALIDGYVNELGHTVKRPGLEEWHTDLGTNAGVDGLYWWDEQNAVISVSAGRVFKHTDFTGTPTELTGATLSSGSRVTFATDRSKLAMANGANIVHTDLSTLTQMADAQAPTAVTHIAYLDGYLIATAGARAGNFSSPTDITAWASTDTFTKAGRPDTMIGLYEGWSELALVGKESLELWYNDGVTPFVRRVNGLIPTGCSAAHTFRQVGNHWMWLDNKRRFVKLESRTPTHISFPYHKLIQTFGAVDDAVSDNIEVAGFPLYVTSFPSAGRTLVYNYQTNGWAEWGYWNTDTGAYEAFRGRSYCYAKTWNLHLVGDRENGIIYVMKRDVFEDNGFSIRTLRRTGFISHGTYEEKHSSQIIFRLKRGVANDDESAPIFTLRWRNHNGAWSNERRLQLGEVGDHYLEYRTHKLGSYKFRQYEICHTDATDFVLVDAKEILG